MSVGALRQLFLVSMTRCLKGNRRLVKTDTAALFDLEYERFPFQLANIAVGAPDGDDIIAFLDFFDEFLLVLRLLLLGPDHKKIKDQNNGTEENKLEPL